MMCGRYMANTEQEIIEIREIIQEISIRLSRDDMAATAGIDAYPTALAPVITPKKELCVLKWGFPKWDSKGVVFNAKRETLLTSRFFTPYIDKGRCIVPASAYYEWLHKNNRATDKYKIFDMEEKPLFMAGIMRPTLEGNGEYVVITRPAADNIAFIHDRMPLMINEKNVLNWLSKDFDRDLLYSDDVRVAYEKVS